tara:strand:- start:56 stop:1144 length:1089 start_codon:yes stop_codon:yes gene_type:complete
MTDIQHFSDFFILSNRLYPNLNQEALVSLSKKIKAISLISGNSFTAYSIFLKKIGGRNYVKFLRLMEINGLIKRSISYKVGRNCKKIEVSKVFDTLEIDLEYEKSELKVISSSIEWKGKYSFLSKLEQSAIVDNLAKITLKDGTRLEKKIKVDQKSNRVYTSVTALSSKESLYVDGRRMIEIDGSATFPTILCKWASGLAPDAPDVKKMQDLIKIGGFYEYMKTRVPLTTKSEGDPLKSAKESAQWWINFNNKKVPVVPNTKAFLKEFPTASRLLMLIKASHSVSRKEARYSTDDIVFDKFTEEESEVWLKKILMRLTESGIICATKHDSVFVDPIYIEDALDIVNEAMTEQFGEFYHLKIK